MVDLRWRALARRAATLALSALLLSSLLPGCGRRLASGETAPSPAPVKVAAAAPDPAAKGSHPIELPGTPLGDSHSVGEARVVDNLALFPIYARELEDLGKFTTLDAALERKSADVREIGAEGGSGDLQNARVGFLVIENKGSLPILVLAGTVVKGGKQDRQIGQDFIIGAGETAPVDAFCVERGRWTGTREGSATEGKFATVKLLAGSDVRAAGQYERDQGKVWDKVGSTNAASGKQKPSGTLLATLDDEELAKKREDLARRADALLDQVPLADHVVGVGYAVDGEVQGVRWFMNHDLYALYEETLLATAAVDAMTASARAKAEGKAAAGGAAAPQAVVDFVTSIRKGQVEERATEAENVNAYRFSDDGYGAETRMKGAPAPGAKPKAVTSDFLKKK
jgi:hypothetical protein